MTRLQDVEVDAALARAAEEYGLDIDVTKLRLVVFSAFAPHESMTESERQFLLDAGAPADSFDPAVQAQARAELLSLAAETRRRASRLMVTSEVASLLNRDPANVRRSAGVGDLYALPTVPGQEKEFPAWQFVDGRPLRGLREVLAELPRTMHPLSIEGFMTTPQDELDDLTPVQWLSTGGDVGVVVALAETVAHT